MERHPLEPNDLDLDELTNGMPLADEDRERLVEMAQDLARRQMPREFILVALRSTAQVLGDMRREEAAGEGLNRADVRRFIEENAIAPPVPERLSARREWKQAERERLSAHTSSLIRDARCARSRHEIKKTRRELLKVDQRHLRRVLGSEGEELCNQISSILRTFASKM
jgi:hypothetical protein